MEAVFIRLLNMSLTASVLAVVVMPLRLGLKRAPKWVHCLMWAMVALRLILPFSFESAASLMPDNEVITYQGEVDSSKPYPDINATNIEVVTPILPGSMRLRIEQTLGTVDVTYFDTLRTSNATVVAGVQYGDQYALAYFHETNDGPVFDRVATMDELQQTPVDGVFRDPSADSDPSCTYLITKSISYAMVPRDFEHGSAIMNSVWNAPKIHI